MSVDVSSEPAREVLRREHAVRLVEVAEEGMAAIELPAGVYGFTSSPVLASPMFAVRRYRNFEVHRLAGGPMVIGFVTARDAADLNDPTTDIVRIHLFPDAEADATTIVAIGYDRIVQHRQYSIRNAEAINLTITRSAPQFVGA